MKHALEVSTLVVLVVALGGCEGSPAGTGSCEDLQAAVAACYQDAALAEAGGCTASAVASREGLGRCNPSGADRADGFWGESPDGSLNWPEGGSGDPAEEDWDIIGLVKALHGAIPAAQLEEIQGRTHDDLLEGAEATVWPAVLDDGLGGLGPRDVMVEQTQGVVPVSVDVFLSLLPADQWGLSLDHHVAGEVRVYARDDQGRVVRQLERMVVNQVPYDGDLFTDPTLAGDMTKVEVIVYDEDGATVYWRVMHSGNGTTEIDVGSVSFRRLVVEPQDDGGVPEEHTLVTFHSAHRLRDALGLLIPDWMLEAPCVGLGSLFVDFTDHYRELVTDAACSDGVDSDADGLVDCDDPDCNCFFRRW